MLKGGSKAYTKVQRRDEAADGFVLMSGVVVSAVQSTGSLSLFSLLLCHFPRDRGLDPESEGCLWLTGSDINSFP